jgi:hypothetical protein
VSGRGPSSHPIFPIRSSTISQRSYSGQRRDRRTDRGGSESPRADLSPLTDPGSGAKWRDPRHQRGRRRRCAMADLDSLGPAFSRRNDSVPSGFRSVDDLGALARITANTRASNCLTEIRRPGSPAGTGKPGRRIEGPAAVVARGRIEPFPRDPTSWPTTTRRAVTSNPKSKPRPIFDSTRSDVRRSPLRLRPRF